MFWFASLMQVRPKIIYSSLSLDDSLTYNSVKGAVRSMESMEKYLHPATVFEYNMCLHKRQRTLKAVSAVWTCKGGETRD